MMILVVAGILSMFFILVFFNNNFYFNSLSYQVFLLVFLCFIIVFLCFYKNQKYLNLFYFFILVLFSYFFFLSSFWLFLFFCFEVVLIPVIFMVLMNGTQIEKLMASNYFVFYGSFFSLPFLFLILSNKFVFGILFIKLKINVFVFSLLLLIFLMKIPLFILHFWLPKVHVEASTEASMILAGLLLKLGTYGLSLLLKMMTKSFITFLWLLALIGFVLMNLTTIFQSDMKSFLAFSSVVHMNFVVLCFCILSKVSKMGSFFLMMGHGFVSTILFWLVGEIYKNNMTRLFYFMKSLFFNNWKFFLIMMIFYLMNLGVPLSINFFSELFGVLSLMKISKISFLLFWMYFIWSFCFTFIMLLNKYMGKSKSLSKETNFIGFMGFGLICVFFIYYF